MQEEMPQLGFIIRETRLTLCMQWSCRCHISITKPGIKIFSFLDKFFFSREPNMRYSSFSHVLQYLAIFLKPSYRLLSGGVCPKPSIKAPQRKRREGRDTGVERENHPPFPFTFYTEIERE